ncbi:hypothetical protein B0H14DRAFT_3491320 [Mycena olivaceomarginata]|nr:hypothetical protein B0H14DRAFT_3491320 [Mycena olivaceomarginata]
MTHENLPRELHQQEFHVHFVSTSPNASASEQFQEFKTAAEATHTDPVEVHDEFGEASCFCLYVNAGASDNPMQSEVACHIGGKGNFYCRKCGVGGTQQEKATNEGYHALFEGGTPRTKEKILKELEKQVELACSGVAKPIQNSQTATGVKDVYTQFWIEDLISRFREMCKDKARSLEDIKQELIQWTVDNRDKIYSPFLSMKDEQLAICQSLHSEESRIGFDPARDTPIEILHTILLGVVKYVWHITHTAWSPEEKQKYAVRLQATNVDGLSIHAIRSAYIMQYAGSLIGRQFKTLVQTNIFHVQSLVSDLKFKAWKAVGKLSALLWVPEIRNPMEYQQDLKVAVGNVLDICEVKLVSLKRGQAKRDNVPLQSTSAASALNFGDYKPDSTWTKCSHVISESLDECLTNSWVFSKGLTDDAPKIIGRVSDILIDPTGVVLVVLERFQVLRERDDVYGMPVLLFPKQVSTPTSYRVAIDITPYLRITGAIAHQRAIPPDICHQDPSPSSTPHQWHPPPAAAVYSKLAILPVPASKFTKKIRQMEGERITASYPL